MVCAEVDALIVTAAAILVLHLALVQVAAAAVGAVAAIVPMAAWATPGRPRPRSIEAATAPTIFLMTMASTYSRVTPECVRRERDVRE